MTTKAQMLEDPVDFSLVLGGPLYQLFRKAHLEGDHLDGAGKTLSQRSLEADFWTMFGKANSPDGLVSQSRSADRRAICDGVAALYRTDPFDVRLDR